MFASLSVEEALRKLESSLQGISDAEVESRKLRYGSNTLPVKKKSLVRLFLSQFNDIMVYILFVALGISIALPFVENGGHIGVENFLDAIVIGTILILNAVLGFVQEYKAEEAIALLQKLSSPHSRVRRDGTEMIIPSADLVPGDIVILEAGDKIAADCRVLKASHLEINESSLTGESAAAPKVDTAIEISDDAPLADRRNMVFSGTLVTRGYAECVVTATGLTTEIGRIAQLVSETELPVTPLQKRMAQLGKTIGLVVIVFCALIFSIGEFEHMAFADILLVAVSLAVSAVPEGLPAVVTVCMAMGVRRMAKKNALVRRLEALETLGSVTVICADKTGTITENRMRVVESWVNDDRYTNQILGQIAASCNHAQLPDVGDPTEIGLLEFAKSNDAERLQIDEEQVPFSSEGKYMQTRHGEQVFLKGAPEVIFAMAVDETDAILKKNGELASRGLRVLAFAEYRGKDIHVVGLIAMEDPPRKTAKQAIAQAAAAGIRTIMITGDNPVTALSIAKKVGIKGGVLVGDDLNSMTVPVLAKKLKTVSVFARVSPQHKLQILKALQSQQEVVAMSGDGVNDAPALKGAHVGVAMGKVGTEVAREASSIVLTDDHFSTIVKATEEGRRIYDNIRKFVLFLLRANFDELIFIGTVILLKLPLPYLPVHILWINLMTDGLPALALGMEPAEPGIMQRPPRKPDEHILAGQGGRLMFSAFFAFAMAFILFLYQISTGVPLDEARTVTLTFAILFELFLAHSTRSEQPIYRIGFFSNPWMLLGTAIPFLFQFILLFTPLHEYFHLTALTPFEWLEVFLLCIGAFVVFEVLKLVHVKTKTDGGEGGIRTLGPVTRTTH